VGLAASAPVAVVDPQTRPILRARMEGLGNPVSASWRLESDLQTFSVRETSLIDAREGLTIVPLDEGAGDNAVCRCGPGLRSCPAARRSGIDAASMPALSSGLRARISTMPSSCRGSAAEYSLTCNPHLQHGLLISRHEFETPLLAIS
jgi:hypothetical protein